MQPGYLYFVALFAIVLPLIPFSAGAAIIAAVWIVGQACFYVLGLESAFLDLGCNLLAALACACIARRDRRQWRSMTLLQASFVMMAGVNAGDITGLLSAYHAWWAILWLALGQVVIVPFNANWRVMKEAFTTVRDLSWMDKLMRVSAWK